MLWMAAIASIWFAQKESYAKVGEDA